MYDVLVDGDAMRSRITVSLGVGWYKIFGSGSICGRKEVLAPVVRKGG